MPCWKIKALGMVLGLLSATLLPAAEMRSLEQLPYILFDNPDEPPMTEMMAALRQVDASRSDNPVAFIVVFSAACHFGSAEDWPALVEIFHQVPVDTYEKSSLFISLSELWLKLRLEAGPLPPVPKVTGKIPEMPGAVAKLPEDLQEAWRVYQQLAPPVNYFSGEEEFVAFQANEEAYWKLTGDLLAGKGGPWSGRLRKYGWGGGCGTGSEVFIGPQSRALFMANLEEKHMTEAVTAALRMPQDMMELGEYKGLEMVHFLRKAGVDWQRAMIGGLVAEDFSEENAFSFYREKEGWLRALTAEGDDRALALLVELARRVPPEKREAYVRALTSCVESAEPGKVYRTPWEARRPKDKPVSPEVQKEILAFFESEVTEQTSMDELRALSQALTMLRRPETKPALRKMVELPSETLAQEAAKMLRDMGESITVPPKAVPARYEVRLNGKPFARSMVEFTLRWGGGSTMTNLKTNDEGVAVVRRDYFLDPARKVDAMEIGVHSITKPEETWFTVDAPLPGNETKPAVVEATVGRFQLRLPLPKTAPQAGEEKIQILLRTSNSPRSPVGEIVAALQVPMTEKVDFAALMPGTYQADIRVPGAVPWSSPIEVTSDGSFTVPLVAGHTVNFQLELPEGWKPTPLQTELLRDGQNVGYNYSAPEKMAFVGVPPGKYVLRLLSSRETGQRLMGQIPADAKAYEGAEVAFTISAEAPREIDLGTIVPGRNSR